MIHPASAGVATWAVMTHPSMHEHGGRGSRSAPAPPSGSPTICRAARGIVNAGPGPAVSAWYAPGPGAELASCWGSAGRPCTMCHTLGQCTSPSPSPLRHACMRGGLYESSRACSVPGATTRGHTCFALQAQPRQLPRPGPSQQDASAATRGHFHTIIQRQVLRLTVNGHKSGGENHIPTKWVSDKVSVCTYV